jgi:hypothetical protein
MRLSRKDTDFRHSGVSQLDYKQVDMDRVLTAFFARLHYDGYPSRLSRTTDLTVDDYALSFLERPDLFAGFEPETTRRWMETDLVDMVNRGRPTQAVAGLRPLHGYTYRFRNARRSRPYGADEQLYSMLAHAPGRFGTSALQLLKEFFFAGVDLRTEAPRHGATVDVETQALISLSRAWQERITDRADRDRSRGAVPPLLTDAAALLAEDVLRLLFHQHLIPRSVLVDHLKILFAFHLALYHLRLTKALPSMIAGKAANGASSGGGLFLDVASVPGTAMARLAEQSARAWYARIPDFVQATYTVRKLDEFAQYLTNRNKRRADPGGGPTTVPELVKLLGPTYQAGREAFAEARLASVLEERTPARGAGDHARNADREHTVNELLSLDLDPFTTYVEIITAYRIDYHRKYLTDCLDSLLLKNRPGAMIAQPRRGERRFILDSRLLEVLLQLTLLREGGAKGFHTAKLRVDEFVLALRERYGLYIDRLPSADGFTGTGITDQAALRANAAALLTKLREIGYYTDLSDAYLTQTITPRYVVDR